MSIAPERPTDLPADQLVVDIQSKGVSGDHTSGEAIEPAAHQTAIASPDQTSSGGAIHLASTQRTTAPLLDPLLTLASITLDDLEKQRIAQENRYRSLTRSGVSEDGNEWGFGLDDRDPNVAAAGAIVDQLIELEKQATKNLQRLMRKHPLGPWVKKTKGVGEKQAARLLGIIGDPYWHGVEDRPRTVSELWAYAGLHTLPADQDRSDTHGPTVGGESYHVAARRKRGQQANWSDEAKKRAWLIAQSCVKSPGGELEQVYRKRKAATEGRVHQAECIRCGPSGKPAQPGTPWSDGHRHADALRITSKELLKQLWKESRKIHRGE